MLRAGKGNSTVDTIDYIAKMTHYTKTGYAQLTGKVRFKLSVWVTGWAIKEWERRPATIVKPSTGQTPTYVHNAATFRDEFKGVTVDDAEVNYYPVSLNTEVHRHQILKMT